ncbi:unnamed protein product [Heligmosomoides polygyrus]|uniref:Aldedh domain-containing protein n=1 Tax=Heligmosomoides polygyrus TaxID=6339 RepID=A0A3P8CI63_HELPZ|nr:unnamed protein product [Heligmosomoides polygyrus]
MRIANAKLLDAFRDNGNVMGPAPRPRDRNEDIGCFCSERHISAERSRVLMSMFIFTPPRLGDVPPAPPRGGPSHSYSVRPSLLVVGPLFIGAHVLYSAIFVPGKTATRISLVSSDKQAASSDNGDSLAASATTPVNLPEIVTAPLARELTDIADDATIYGRDARQLRDATSEAIYQSTSHLAQHVNRGNAALAEGFNESFTVDEAINILSVFPDPVANEKPIAVRVAESTTLKPGTETFVPCYTSRLVETPVMLVAQSSQLQDKFIMVASAILRLGTMKLLVSNPTERPELLYKDQRISDAVPVVEEAYGILSECAPGF